MALSHPHWCTTHFHKGDLIQCPECGEGLYFVKHHFGLPCRSAPSSCVMGVFPRLLDLMYCVRPIRPYILPPSKELAGALDPFPICPMCRSHVLTADRYIHTLNRGPIDVRAMLPASG